MWSLWPFQFPIAAWAISIFLIEILHFTSSLNSLFYFWVMMHSHVHFVLCFIILYEYVIYSLLSIGPLFSCNPLFSKVMFPKGKDHRATMMAWGEIPHAVLWNFSFPVMEIGQLSPYSACALIWTSVLCLWCIFCMWENSGSIQQLRWAETVSLHICVLCSELEPSGVHFMPTHFWTGQGNLYLVTNKFFSALLHVRSPNVPTFSITHTYHS